MGAEFNFLGPVYEKVLNLGAGVWRKSQVSPRFADQDVRDNSIEC